MMGGSLMTIAKLLCVALIIFHAVVSASPKNIVGCYEVADYLKPVAEGREPHSTSSDCNMLCVAEESYYFGIGNGGRSCYCFNIISSIPQPEKCSFICEGDGSPCGGEKSRKSNSSAISVYRTYKGEYEDFKRYDSEYEDYVSPSGPYDEWAVEYQSYHVNKVEYIKEKASKRLPGHTARVLVMHFTAGHLKHAIYMLSQQKSSGVSVHWIMPEEPYLDNRTAVSIVEESKGAYQAGFGHWRDLTSKYMFSDSIGIEISNLALDKKKTNPKSFMGYYPYTQYQVELLADLSLDIMRRNNIPMWGIAGHRDIAPNRKDDPGPNFPWEYLASRGVGIWIPRREVEFNKENKGQLKSLNDIKPVWEGLEQIGYQTNLKARMNDALFIDEDFKYAVSAFRLRFLPWKNNIRRNLWKVDEEVRAFVLSYASRFGRDAVAEFDKRLPIE